MMKEALKKQYFCEKSLIEMWGYQSVLTFEEWLQIKNKRDERIRNNR